MVARRALFALFEKKVLTTSLGQASDPWRWRALFPRAGGGALPSIVRGPREARPPVTAPRIERVQTVQAAPAEEEASAQATLLRGKTVAGRSREAQHRLDQARLTAASGDVHGAVSLLRQALGLAPRDIEISRLLGQLAFKDRLSTT